MTGSHSTLSPKDLARAIDASESSLKRWIDGGRLRADRTAGGHRRVRVDEAVRFIRDSGLSVVRPDLLGLASPEIPSAPLAPDVDCEEQLFEYLERGEGDLARGLLLSLYVAGHSVAEICDGPLRSALERIGTMWEEGTEGILIEHRATDICIQALNQLRSFIPPNQAPPIAIGGAPSDDPYILPSLCAATVLSSEGFDARNLGPNLPFETFLEGARVNSPRLLWLTISRVHSVAEQNREFAEFHKELTQLEIPLIVGGRERSRLEIPTGPLIHTGSSMGELASFARGILVSQR